MPLNVINIPYEIFSVVAGILVAVGAALAFSFRHKSTNADAGEKGPRPPGSEEDVERVSPDGFIDSFAGVISEAGGGMPVIGWVIIGVTAVCYVAYLFLFLNPGR